MATLAYIFPGDLEPSERDTRGVSFAFHPNTDQYGIWPVDGYFAGVDELSGVLIHHEGSSRHVSADVVVDTEHNVRVRGYEDTDLLAAAEVIEELALFGFRGKLKLSRSVDGPVVLQAELGGLADKTEKAPEATATGYGSGG